MSSNGIHELIGSEPIVDQFELSRAIENFGNYLDNYVATSVEDPVKRVLSLVQSRLTTEKGSGGAASATITLPPNLFGFSTDSGPNNGDRIAIKDGIGQVGHFYGFRGIQEGPTTDAGVTPRSKDSDGNGQTDFDYSAFFSWSGTHVAIPNANGGHGVAYSLEPVSNDYPGSGATYSSQESPESGDTPDFIYAFRIVGGDHTGTQYSHSERTQTMNNLISAINASGLRVSCDLESDPLSLGMPISITLTLTDSGTNAEALSGLAKTNAQDLYASLQDDYSSFNISSFSGATNLLDSSLGSFVKISPTQDGTRVYADSLLTNSSIGFSNSSFGTMQTSGEEIRPKYYLDSRKYGQSAHFLEQGKDSKSDFNLKTRRTGLINVLKGESLGSPVRAEFVSGSTSDSTATRSFRRRSASQTTSVNKTINSVLTGAFYDA